MRGWMAVGLVVGAALACQPGPADAGSRKTDHVFKTVKVPAAGTRKRITVQIRPEALKPKPVPAATVPKAPGPLPSYAWFWEDVATDLAVSPSLRFARALAALEEGASSGKALFGSHGQLRAIAATYAAEIRAASAATGVSPALILAVMSVESGGNRKATSPKGAQGLMQLMPGTAARFNVADTSDPAANILGGATYLSLLLRQFGEDPVLSLAGYNAGENAVIRNAGVPNYRETRDYVPKVLGAWLRARSLCETPPATVRDDCRIPL